MAATRMQSEITIRDATLEDREFVLNTARRLADYGAPSWRTVDEIVTREQQGLQDFFDQPQTEAAVIIAERPGEGRVGYLFLEVTGDYFTGHRVGHISSVAVVESADGQGVASALMIAAEKHARKKKFSHLTLNVFAAHQRAREIYEHLNFSAETVHYVKILNDSSE